MSFLESIYSLISHESDEEEVAGSSVRGHRTDGGLSDPRQVGVGSNRLHTRTHTHTRSEGGHQYSRGLQVVLMTRKYGSESALFSRLTAETVFVECGSGPDGPAGRGVKQIVSGMRGAHLLVLELDSAWGDGRLHSNLGYENGFDEDGVDVQHLHIREKILHPLLSFLKRGS